MSICRIADVCLDAQGAPRTGSVRARYPAAPIYVRAGGHLAAAPRVKLTPADGSWFVDVLWSSLLDPDAVLELRFDDGAIFSGLVPELPGPLSLEQLRAEFGWLPPSDSTVALAFDDIGLRAAAWMGPAWRRPTHHGFALRAESTQGRGW